MHDRSNKVYIVMGAPGSATSFISKALEEQGVKMGNTKGDRLRFYENKEFGDLNTEILEKAGGSSTEPPLEKEILKVDVDNKIKKLIKKYKDRFWGWKDPKNSLTVKKYLPYLEDDVYLICCFRKPKHILNEYNWFRKRRSDEENMKLVNAYNKAIISAIKEFTS